MKNVHIAAFLGSGISEVVVSLSDIEMRVKAIDADFDALGVSTDRLSRTARVAESIKTLKNKDGGDFAEVAYLLAYTFDRRHTGLAEKYGLVAILITDSHIDNMHIVDCDTGAEYKAFIESMRRIVADSASHELLDRTVARHGADLAMTRQIKMAGSSLMDALPATISLLAPDGTIVSVNAAWRQFAAENGLDDPAALVGQNYLAVCDAAVASGDSAEAAEAVGAGLRAVLAGRRPMFSFDYPCHSPTEQRWFRLMATPVDIEGGRGVVAMHINITALRRTEMALHEAETMKAMGQLASGYAHDVRNFLSVIVGQLDLISRRVGETPARRNIDMARVALDHVTGLTERLLSVARPKPADHQPIDPNAVIAGIAELLQQAAGPAVDLCLQLTPAVGLVRIAPHELESALLQLAGSARDAMPRGGRLAIETRYAVSAGQSPGTATELQPLGEHVQIVVRDTGAGMPPEALARVFEPRSASNGPAGGSGIGLAQVYNVVRQAGGEVAIESAPGEGTAVTIRLPRVRAMAAAAQNAA
jgi:signal transduction histidine kinase